MLEVNHSFYISVSLRPVKRKGPLNCCTLFVFSDGVTLTSCLTLSTHRIRACTVSTVAQNSKPVCSRHMPHRVQVNRKDLLHPSVPDLRLAFPAPIIWFLVDLYSFQMHRAVVLHFSSSFLCLRSSVHWLHPSHFTF
jgi:hypothetical protein